MVRRDATRRTFLKTASALGVTSIGALAGCTGGNGGGSSDGSSGGSSGGSGDGSSGGSSDGSSGGSTGSKDLTKVNISMAPDGFQGIVMDYINEKTDILANAMHDNGYEPNVQKSFEGAAIFASGGADFETMSTLEAVRLGVNRDMKLACNAKLAPMFMGWMVKTGGDYDPENTGSVQKSIDALAKNGLVGIGDWGGGDVPAETIALGNVYGYKFQEENGDFKVTTADYNVIPRLIVEGKLDAGSTSPIHGGAPYLVKNPPEVTKLFWTAELLADKGVGRAPLNNWTTRADFAEQESGAVEALVQSWHKGMQWLFDNPGKILEDKKHLDQLGVKTKAQGQYIIDWGINLNKDSKFPIVYKDVELTDDWISSNKDFLTNANKLGFVPDGWQDKLTYRKVPQS